MKKIASLLLTAALTVPACASVSDLLIADTKAGAVEGVRDDAVTRYRGIPYAAPPVGDRRFSPPQPPAAWDGVRSAKKSGPACAQGPARKDAAEDCLYLDVTAPPKAKDRPVMVWLHGGGFSEGAGFDYDPARLVAQGDVVVVTVEFRLGLYGFLTGDNNGFQDQQAALRWVRDNIREFGGDPGNVTLFGESGGAIGACAQLGAPGARGLFHRAILQSGNCDAALPKNYTPTGSAPFRFFRPAAETAKVREAAMKAVGCDDLDCLRRQPVDKLRKQYDKFGAATYGTPALPEDPAVAVEKNHIPLLYGWNQHESRLVSGIFAVAGWRMTAQEYPGLIADAFGADEAAAIVREYPPSRYGGDAAVAWGDVFTDTASCGQRPLPGYRYEFADENAQPFVDLPPDFEAGASHASELPNLFEVAGRKPITSDRYTDAQRALADRMIGYWTAFARTGDPNHEGAPVWPEEGALQLKPNAIEPVDVAKLHRCDFWNTL
ncbi:carboxylesterase family protein [Actinoplanes sp. Pm04-4]|uniref:Carboxylic ester hydrolase n=1 Tax=Paractinoplanes pyxinae TaxID=2997416 RepID=A0ABT4BGJ5_9ACTN|nr:carboxylesterase family protein [Actinoplanes pyxinae]MCY1145653.1 carboxylesterase family protein [Actinoplanes pyxinae]